MGHRGLRRVLGKGAWDCEGEKEISHFRLNALHQEQNEAERFGAQGGGTSGEIGEERDGCRVCAATRSRLITKESYSKMGLISGQKRLSYGV